MNKLHVGLKKVFDTAEGVGVLEELMQEYVLVANPTGDLFIEGKRALVLEIIELIEYKEE